MQFTTNSDSKQITADRPRRQLKTKRARCESAAIRTKKFGLEAVSLIQRKKGYLMLTCLIFIRKSVAYIQCSSTSVHGEPWGA